MSIILPASSDKDIRKYKDIFMANTDNLKNAFSFKEEANIKNRITVLYDRLKRHMSSEYVAISETKDGLENEILEIKFELEQKDKKLFKASNQKDTRRYFSPLNLAGIEEDQKDEKIRQLTSDLRRLESQVEQHQSMLNEIKDLLLEMESIQKEMDHME